MSIPEELIDRLPKFPVVRLTTKAYFEGSGPQRGRGTAPTYLLLGEIAGAPGHCVLLDDENQVHQGYHTSDFELVHEDEI